MKKKLLYLKIVILLITASSKAQIYYSHYLDGTSEWRYYSSAGEINNVYSKTYRTIFFDGTEDYAGYTYHRERFFTVIKYYESINQTLLYQDEFYPTLYNLVREDEQGRFYRRPYFDYTVEEMYQDNTPILNSQIGDNFPSLPDFNFGVCPITSIENFNIAGLSLKWLKGYTNSYGGLVEGIGPVGQACDAGGGLECYTKQNESKFFVPNTLDCSIFPEPVRLGNTNFYKSKVVVFPNPTKGIVTIKTSDAIEKIELWDAQGRKLLTQQNTTIDITAYPEGIYLLKIDTETGLQTQKIIKN